MSNKYNPDILTCLANLSNDEVFTLPKTAQEMLNSLPEDIWSNKNIKLLDPFTKSGVFLREATKRFMIGLENEFPDSEERINHILKNQIFGIAITELTSLISRRTLYCAKNANSNLSVANVFNTDDGNIFYKNQIHT